MIKLLISGWGCKRMTISSDLGTAQQKATAISNALTTLTGIGSATLDTQTTVQGNQSAQEAIQATVMAGTQISTAVRTATQNLQTVAKGFEAVDKQVKHSLMSSPLGGLK